MFLENKEIYFVVKDLSLFYGKKRAVLLEENKVEAGFSGVLILS